MMRQSKRLVWLSLAGLFFGGFSLQVTQADEAAINQMLTGYIEAFNKHDVDSVAGFWTANCVHIDRATNSRTEGREVIATDLKDVFESTPDARLSGTVKSVHLIQPTVATVEGETMLSGGGNAPVASMFTAVMVLEGNKWMLASVDESPAMPASSPQDALSELEWLVGHWRDQSDNAVVETKCRWSPSGAFLLRSYVVEIDADQASEGTQVIGWDANKQSIRSWNFDSSGGFGEATWVRSGDEWLVRSLQTSVDGTVSSGTYVLKKLDADSMEVQLIAQDVDGVPAPNQPPILVLRVAEDETVDAAQTEPVGNGVAR
jgi:uncharacterized protein (TIGR02246 family)